MKILVTVSLFLFSHFTGRAIHGYNAPVKSKSSFAFALTREEQKFGIPESSKALYVEKISHLNQDIPDLLLLEEEDDENIIKTHLRKYYAFFSDVFFPVEFISPKETISFGRGLYHTNCCKYIVQRVLKI